MEGYQPVLMMKASLSHHRLPFEVVSQVVPFDDQTRFVNRLPQPRLQTKLHPIRY